MKTSFTTSFSETDGLPPSLSPEQVISDPFPPSSVQQTLNDACGVWHGLPTGGSDLVPDMSKLQTDT